MSQQALRPQACTATPTVSSYGHGYLNYSAHLTRLAMDAYLAHATLEVAFVLVLDEGVDTGFYALLHRFVWPY